MKKQLMAGMMAASMALSLAACGGSAASSAAPAADSTSGAASTSTAASTSSDEQVTLRFAWWGGDERANATMEVINKFMEENPNIKIEAEYGSSDGYHDKLATQLASGTAADIVQIDPETMPSFVSTGDYFLDYKDYDFDLSNFDPNYIGLRVNGNYDGKQLGLPTGIAGPALVVNEELAEKYGIDFNTQYTWDQFIEWGKQVHEADPDTYLLCTNKEYVTNLVFFTYMKQLTGKTIFDADSKEFNYTEEDIQNCLDLVKSLYDNNVCAPATLPLTATMTCSLTPTGSLASTSAPSLTSPPSML